MLVERPLAGDVGDLRLGAFQLGLGAGDVEAGGEAAGVARLGQRQRPLIGGDRVGQQRALCIEAAQAHVVVRELGFQAEADRSEVAGRGLRLRLACGGRVAQLAPEVEVVGDAAAQRVAAVVGRLVGAAQRPVGRLAIGGDGHRAADGRVERGRGLGGEGTGLVVARHGFLQRGVGPVDARLQPGQGAGRRRRSTNRRARARRLAQPRSTGRSP